MPFPSRSHLVLSLVGLIFGVTASATSANLICVRALTGDIAMGPDRIARVADHLLERTFSRIDSSDVFKAGQVIARITPEGMVRLYFEKYYWPADWMSRAPFAMLSAREGVLAVLKGRDGRLNVIETKHADAPFPKADLARPEARRPMIDQLHDGGFSPIRGADGVLERPGHEGEADRLAIVQDGRLERLFATAPAYVVDQMPEAYRVVGVTQHLFDNGNYSGPFSELILTDGARELTVTSFDSDAGRIVRETILEPIVVQSSPKPSTPRAGGASEFVIGGENSETAIRNLKSLNGISLDEIERALRPHTSSMAGFLGTDEALIDVLLEDNATVTRTLGLTHQRIAEPLFTARKIWQNAGYDRAVQFTIEGRRFEVQGTAWRGMQHSPFGDTFGTNSDFTVKNLETNAVVKYSGLLPDLINAYGFYEGHGTHYRVDPRDVVRVFDYLGE